MAIFLDVMRPSIGAKNIGVSAVAGSGRASVHHHIAINSSIYAHLDIYNYDSDTGK